MKTLSYRDPSTNSIISLYVDSTKFHHSNRGDLSCTDCHDNGGFQRYPHTHEAKAQHLYCTDCHESEDFKQFEFKQREAEFNQIIHHQKLGDKFTCFNCHDPHSFKTTFHDQATDHIIKQDNAICLNCHAAPSQLSKLSDAPQRFIYCAQMVTKARAALENSSLY